MTIKIWQSYSCNNSSSYRLVARFADAKTATATATELAAFFTAHAEQMDAVMEEGGFPDDNPEAAQQLAKQYGFAWDDVLTWGDEMLTGDEPTLATEDNVLVVYHTYCGGFGKGIPAYLTARGATVDQESRSAPTLSVLFDHVPSPALDADLDRLLAQVEDSEEVEPLDAPWGGREMYGSAAFFRDPDTVGLYFPIAPEDFDTFRTWLASHGITRSSIRVCEYGDQVVFAAVAAARCTACNGPLRYLDPRFHDIETEQLVCKPCGGLYELSTFLDNR